jgi:uncharacterized protein (TIGR03083 family)
MTMRPSSLLLQTRGACDLDPEHLFGVFGEQRGRFVAVLRGFGPDDWALSTRCAKWSAHDVVRHLCDANKLSCKTVGAGRDDGTLDIGAGFDPRVTPREWLTATAGESPEVTLARLVATTEELLGLARGRLARSASFDARLPYGWMDWTVLLLHDFWDSWLHERDVLLGRGVDHPTNDDATFYATAYGLFMAAVVASLFGDPAQERVTLGGDGGGVFDLGTCDGVVTLSVSRLTTAGPPAAKVTDALAGRSSVAAVLADLPANARAALSHLANFFNTPVEQSQT